MAKFKIGDRVIISTYVSFGDSYYDLKAIIVSTMDASAKDYLIVAEDSIVEGFDYLGDIIKSAKDYEVELDLSLIDEDDLRCDWVDEEVLKLAKIRNTKLARKLNKDWIEDGMYLLPPTKEVLQTN